MRGAVLAALAVVLSMDLGVPPQAASPSLDAKGLAVRQAADLRSEAIYREGIARLVTYARSRSDLFPAAPSGRARLLGESDRETVRGLWKSLLDYYLALDSLGAITPTRTSSRAAAWEPRPSIWRAALSSPSTGTGSNSSSS